MCFLPQYSGSLEEFSFSAVDFWHFLRRFFLRQDLQICDSCRRLLAFLPRKLQYDLNLDTKCGVEGNGLFIVFKAEVFCRELDGVSGLISFHVDF